MEEPRICSSGNGYRVSGNVCLPDGHRVSEVLESPVERRYQADGRARTGCRRRRVRVMSVLGPVPVVAEIISAATVPGHVQMCLGEYFRIQIRQVVVFFVYLSVQTSNF